MKAQLSLKRLGKRPKYGKSRMFWLILINFILLASVLVVYGVDGSISSFDGESNPLYLTFETNNILTKYINLYSYTYLKNLSLSTIFYPSDAFADTFDRSDGDVNNGWSTHSLYPNGYTTIKDQRMIIVGGNTEDVEVLVNHSISTANSISFIFSINETSQIIHSRLRIFNTSTLIIICYINIDGFNEQRIHCDNGATPTLIETIDLNKDYKMNLVLDLNNFKYNVTLNDTLKAQNLNFKTEINTINILQFGSKNRNTSIDNVNVSSSLSTEDTIILNISNTQSVKNNSLNISIINNILKGGCVCSGCSESNSVCSIPFNFFSSVPSYISFNITNASYSFGFDNCSNVSAIPSEQEVFTFFTKDERENTLINSNVSFYIKYYVSEPEDYYIYSSTLYDKSIYTFCEYPAWADLSSTMSNIISADGYETKTFNKYNWLMNENITEYLISTLYSGQITFTLRDTSGSIIEGASFIITRIIDGEETQIYNALSNTNGQVITYLDLDYTYTYIINATGYPLKTLTFQPTASSYTIILTSEGTNYFENNYANKDIVFKIEPPTSMWNVSDDYTNITFYLYGSNLEYWGINISSKNNYSCDVDDCSAISTSSNGGSVNLQLNLSEPGRFYTSLFYKRPGESVTYLNSYPNDAVVFVIATNSLMDMLRVIKDNTSPMVRNVLVGFFNTFVVVLGASIGIFGWAAIMLVVFSTIFFALPPMPIIGFEGVQLIDPNVALITLIFALGAFVFASMTGDA